MTTDATNSTDRTAEPPDGVTYTQAVAELDTILRELEASDVDVDHLAQRVERAATLIALCRTRIAAARVHVENVTADLDAAAGFEQP